ncbi:MAG: hypothetical protein LBE79_13330 [Tannerella sp.]|nr:hypothetical protein [Tannerella sp.]
MRPETEVSDILHALWEQGHRTYDTQDVGRRRLTLKEKAHKFRVENNGRLPKRLSVVCYTMI